MKKTPADTAATEITKKMTNSKGGENSVITKFSFDEHY